ncbi:hypothetical protein Mal52_14210 [Symmachiella dynata]|uniref:Uncharacterized protein n=1 Tax=Symmachiella dynata TaxID=2527995 RepID=A0A517ZKE3_9PLAN|nr:hypothetical protein Mal52_14210 [Symmachiella dynata]
MLPGGMRVEVRTGLEYQPVTLGRTTAVRKIEVADVKLDRMFKIPKAGCSAGDSHIHCQRGDEGAGFAQQRSTTSA